VIFHVVSQENTLSSIVLPKLWTKF